uniref:DOMON domain-containing protein n=1 Tax=Skeletonema marinoi TaxID=267567 RepID=A0A7S2PHN9_9STRA|mmetsp:Transcript_22714/g.38778  ORF Transcript_22714/g.38778 Transcript_22714/m.38778 type:complete len:230 (+) Transcript_22714:70-759(+)|eukprot:CAMPEP_0113389684 /NCGR_PEP_ID=MMETSP0013_2-20120614/9757_1 /TAXON_ID=2843 ORGANISM="Skeletonema costatum, Strain 1716" /NCGR_SAMPLE_ID=MMETSP0013_2 /ASSEMBLY_ACC=CAM_ASM_000158 /LENGTH=229 /DNA_ID=CAMNT_0000272775 /DNA_START=59 /DNA_END=748 /DNA_ORIENTATION=- /assembly_acc=CAM_ASM_000158
MKTVSAALFFALIGTAAAAESCPDELPGKVELDFGLAFHYGILETDQALCGKLVSDTEVWVGFAAQPEGKKQMIDANAVIALPEANTVQQYTLTAKSAVGIVPTDSQTLTDTTVTQEDGTTVATFKQPLSDNGLTLTSNNVYLMAKGTSNNLGYHAGRGFVSLDFETNVISSSTGSTEAPMTTGATESGATPATEAPPTPTPPPSSASLQKIGSVLLGGSLLLIATLTI